MSVFYSENKPNGVASLSFFGTFMNRVGGVTDFFSDSISGLCWFLSAHWSLASTSCVLCYGPWAAEQTAFHLSSFLISVFVQDTT